MKTFLLTQDTTNRIIGSAVAWIVAVWVTTIVLALASPARAEDAGTCYTISDADARTYCLARAHQDSGRCYAIQRPDMRAQCLAEVRR